MRVFEETPGEPEVPLAGGDVTEGVVRVGGTVRRPPTPFTPAIRALLAHLEAAGFEGAPRPLGVDAAGREVLTFLPGLVPPRPLPGWAAADRVLAGVARLQRRYHDAAASFVPPPGAVWDAPPDPRELPPMEIAPELGACGGSIVIGHCDVTPDNVVFRDTPDGPEPWGLIDFDLAKPSSRLLDIVTTLRHWAPLSDPADRVPSLAGLDAGRRARLFCDAYGLDAAGRGGLLDLADARLERSWYLMKARAEDLGGGWARMWDEGVGDRIRRASAWLRRERASLEDALR